MRALVGAGEDVLVEQVVQASDADTKGGGGFRLAIQLLGEELLTLDIGRIGNRFLNPLYLLLGAARDIR